MPNPRWIEVGERVGRLVAMERRGPEQAEGLREHFRKQGAAAKGDPDDVALDWPLVPGPVAATAGGA